MLPIELVSTVMQYLPLEDIENINVDLRDKVAFLRREVSNITREEKWDFVDDSNFAVGCMYVASSRDWDHPDMDMYTRQTVTVSIFVTGYSSSVTLTERRGGSKENDTSIYIVGSPQLNMETLDRVEVDYSTQLWKLTGRQSLDHALGDNLERSILAKCLIEKFDMECERLRECPHRLYVWMFVNLVAMSMRNVRHLEYMSDLEDEAVLYEGVDLLVKQVRDELVRMCDVYILDY